MTEAMLRTKLREVAPEHPAAKDERIPVGAWFVNHGVWYERLPNAQGIAWYRIGQDGRPLDGEGTVLVQPEVPLERVQIQLSVPPGYDPDQV